MPAKIIDGKQHALEIKQKAAIEVQELQKQGVTPFLIVFLVGDDPASSVYVKGKAKDCAECGIRSEVVKLPTDTSQEELLLRVQKANEDDSIHGILVQLPLPPQIEEKQVIEAVSPQKDVDGFTAINIGRLQIGEECFVPCTPAACIYLLEAAGVDLAGKDAVVVGRSNIVGKPVSLLLLQKSATVTICHSKTKNLAAKCVAADVIVAAVGRQGFITKDMVKTGAVVIDVGINRGTDGKLHGDVAYEEVHEKAAAITPVPGGVGPMTRAMLMLNTVKAAQMALRTPNVK